VGNIPDVSESHVATIFRVEICKMDGFICIYKILFREETEWGLREKYWCPVWPNRDSGRGKTVQTALLRAPEYNRKSSPASGFPEQSPTP
jgi:hypothetical protein